MLAACIAIVCTSAVFAGGFQINEHGAKAMGMGGAFVAQASDPSAIFFNPAGIGFQKGFHAMLGATLIMPATSHTTPGGVTTDMESQIFYPPNAYVTYGLEQWSFGLGFYAPFGLGTEWPESWPGQRDAVKADLHAFYVNPTVAFRPIDCLSLGFGFSYIFSDVALTRRVGVPPLPLSTDGTVELDADGTSWDFSAGVLYTPTKEFSIGASYRHSAEVEYEGTATFSNMPTLTLPPPIGAVPLAPFFPGGTGKTMIQFPNQGWLGVAVTPVEPFTLEMDVQWIRWSTYEALTIDLPVGPVFPLTGRPLQGPSTSVKDWFDTFMARIGGEYRWDKIALRLGFVYDFTPQPERTTEPLLPDADRAEGTIGLGFKLTKNLGIDVAYQFLMFKDRTLTTPPTSFPGTYESSASIFGLDVTYNP
jgi:long-chain fatty acid transport protein